MVPRIVNSLFTGRSEVVERMQSALRNRDSDTTKQQRVVIVITGTGGMGKSEVCLKVADLMREECASPAYCRCRERRMFG
jgi:Mrp family chromosome partitioning ATPase